MANFTALNVHISAISRGQFNDFQSNNESRLAAEWFGPDERTLATTIAINANQIGIAMSYLCGAYLVHDVEDFHGYFLLVRSNEKSLKASRPSWMAISAMSD